jgi:pseudouridine synthase
MTTGISLDDGVARAAEAKMLSPTRFRLVMAEGRKRVIRRMMIALGSRVVSLHRIQIGRLRLGDLPEGRWRELNSAEKRELLE